MPPSARGEEALADAAQEIGNASDSGDVLAAFDANMVTSVRSARAAVPSMRERRWGRICFVTSYSVKQPIPTLARSDGARTGFRAWAKTEAGDSFAERSP